MLASEGKAHVPSKAREEWNEKNQPGKRAVSIQQVPTLQPGNSTPRHTHRRKTESHCPQKAAHRMLTAALFITVKNCNQPKHSASRD